MIDIISLLLEPFKRAWKSNAAFSNTATGEKNYSEIQVSAIGSWKESTQSQSPYYYRRILKCYRKYIPTDYYQKKAGFN